MIVAFTGGMGVGKSTAIKELEKMGYYVTLSKFAAPLYDMQEFIYRRVSTVFPKPSNFQKDRKLLQWLGTEWGRGNKEDMWVSLWKQDVAQLQETLSKKPSLQLIVVDDCRFDNEAEAIKAMGGHIIRIVSDKTADRGVDRGISNHSSENGISQKYLLSTIENNGSIEQLRESLKRALALIDLGEKK
jgi:hypothetical protein